jgi:hypothetical protein
MEEKLLFDFIELHGPHDCLKNPDIHQIFEEFSEFYQEEKGDKSGGKILLFKALEMRSKYLKDKKHQFYNSFYTKAFKTLTKICENAFNVLLKEYDQKKGYLETNNIVDENEILENLGQKIQNLTIDQNTPNVDEAWLDFNFGLSEKYEYLLIDDLSKLSNLKGGTHLLLEISEPLDPTHYFFLINSKSTNLIIFFPHIDDKSTLNLADSCSCVDYYISSLEHKSKKHIQFKKSSWIDHWIECCKCQSVEYFFTTDSEKELYKKALFENDTESITNIGSMFYSYQQYNESFRFLSRASNNNDVSIYALSLLKIFSDEGIADVGKCSIKSESIKERIIKIV